MQTEMTKVSNAVRRMTADTAPMVTAQLTALFKRISKFENVSPYAAKSLYEKRTAGRSSYEAKEQAAHDLAASKAATSTTAEKRAKVAELSEVRRLQQKDERAKKISSDIAVEENLLNERFRESSVDYEEFMTKGGTEVQRRSVLKDLVSIGNKGNKLQEKANKSGVELTGLTQQTLKENKEQTKALVAKAPGQSPKSGGGSLGPLGRIAGVAGLMSAITKLISDGWKRNSASFEMKVAYGAKYSAAEDVIGTAYRVNPQAVQDAQTSGIMQPLREMFGEVSEDEWLAYSLSPELYEARYGGLEEKAAAIKALDARVGAAETRFILSKTNWGQDPSIQQLAITDSVYGAGKFEKDLAYHKAREITRTNEMILGYRAAVSGNKLLKGTQDAFATIPGAAYDAFTPTPDLAGKQTPQTQIRDINVDMSGSNFNGANEDVGQVVAEKIGEQVDRYNQTNRGQ